MRQEDDPGGTTPFWKVQFTDYGETIDSPHDTIRPAREGRDTLDRRASHVLSRLLSEGRAGRHGAGLELGETIGAGGTGEIRRAHQVAVGRDVAVKMLRPHKRKSSAVVDLLREAWVTGSLEHPNVVPVYDLVVDAEGSPLIVMQHIEGVVWSQLIRDGKEVRRRFGVEDLLEWNLGILMQVLNAVRYAHNRGIVHRDLKPDNVMIGEFGQVYLVDWGLAVSLCDDETGRVPLAENATALAGTPCYMAPEMLGDSDVPITERTDIYLAGAILYEILTGHPPHVGRNAMAVIASVVMPRYSFPTTTPAPLERICRRAMDQDPHGRFGNAEQVRLALQGFLRHRGAERLASRAEASLAELDGHLARGPATGESEHRQILYNLYGACRFGFREALAIWPGSPTAEAGLERATVAMVEYELGQGDARAAAALAADLGEVPAALDGRIERGLAEQREARQRGAQLEALGKKLDTRIEQGTRAVAALLLGAAFAAAPPLATWLWPWASFDSYPKQLTWTAILGVLPLIAGWVLRDKLREDNVNRRLLILVMVLIVALFPLQLGCWGAGIAPIDCLVIHEAVWCFWAGAVALLYDWRLLPASLGYLATFFVMVLVPDSRPYIASVPHAVVAINYVLVWRGD